MGRAMKRAPSTTAKNGATYIKIGVFQVFLKKKKITVGVPLLARGERERAP
jgi:hypothetical protein